MFGKELLQKNRAREKRAGIKASPCSPRPPYAPGNSWVARAAAARGLWRDEAHRWAIGAHRAKRSAAIKKNPLDEIEGIGPSRKKALLQYFGSAKGVARAKLADLKEVEGVSAALAERIYGHFNSG